MKVKSVLGNAVSVDMVLDHEIYYVMRHVPCVKSVNAKSQITLIRISNI